MQIIDARKIGSGQTLKDGIRDICSSSECAVYAVGAERKDGICVDYYYDGVEELGFLYECTSEPDVDTFISSYCRVVDTNYETRCEDKRNINLDHLVLTVAHVTMALKGLPHCEDSVYEYLPLVSRSWDKSAPKIDFKEMESIGFYLIVPDEKWFTLASSCGVKTIQLRVKDKLPSEVEGMIASCSDVASKHGVKFIVNDYWELALKYNAYGVHLGQDAIKTADMDCLSKSGIRLGISTHCYHELARANFYRPSYIALGPIYDTTSKSMQFFRPQGLGMLKRWADISAYPVVAIGGITLSNIHDVMGCGAKGAAVISAVTGAADPVTAINAFLAACDGKNI